MSLGKIFHPVTSNNEGLINTYEGHIIDLRQPTLEGIDIKDIANALSKICRFNGHVKTHINVALHSIMAARMCVNPKEKLAYLLHDATEAYLGDIVTPLKHILGYEFAVIEQRFEDVIFEKFNVQPFNHGELKVIDNHLLVLEHEYYQADISRNYELLLMDLFDFAERRSIKINPIRFAYDYFLSDFYTYQKEVSNG